MNKYDEILRDILLEKIKNPGKYYGGDKQKAGIDSDGDGVPDGADKEPEDGSIQEEMAEELEEISTSASVAGYSLPLGMKPRKRK